MRSCPSTFPVRAVHLVVVLLAGLALAPARSASAGTIEEARVACAAENWPEAARLFGEVLEKDEANREAALGLARAVLKGNIPDALGRAERSLQKALAKEEADREARVALGEVYLAIAATKDDAKAMEFVLKGDAAPQFEAVLAADPSNEAAAVGLARTRYQTGEFDAALKVLDGLLARKPTSALGLYWKGQTLYVQGVDAFNAGRADEAKAAFERARGAYEASSRADPSSYETWMQIAYSAQYLGDGAGAEAAYSQAMARNAESPWPLKGIEALYAQRPPAEHLAALEALAGKHPKNVAVHLALGRAHLKAERYADAVASFQKYLGASKSPGSAAYELGLAHAGQKDEAGAVKAFEAALDANPDDFLSAEQLDRRLRDRHGMAARSTLGSAKAALAAYAPLRAKAPRNPYVRNNLGFILREAYVTNGQAKDWVPILEASVKAYEEAADIIGEWSSEMERTVAWGVRYGYAQILSDTGLMFQFYEPTRDYAKAERYYRRALEFSDSGYFDTFTNLLAIYKATQRWQKAYDLAADCAEGLKDESGNPHETGRAAARGEMKRLVDEGKATE